MASCRILNSSDRGWLQLISLVESSPGTGNLMMSCDVVMRHFWATSHQTQNILKMTAWSIRAINSASICCLFCVLSPCHKRLSRQFSKGITKNEQNTSVKHYTPNYWRKTTEYNFWKFLKIVIRIFKHLPKHILLYAKRMKAQYSHIIYLWKGGKDMRDMVAYCMHNFCIWSLWADFWGQLWRKYRCCK